MKPQNTFDLDDEISEDKENSIDEKIKKYETTISNSLHRIIEPKNILSTNTISIKPMTGDETPKSYISQFEVGSRKEGGLINDLFAMDKIEKQKEY